MRPIIGVTCSLEQQQNKYCLAECYVQAISKAGGIAVILPYISIEMIGQILKTIDGVVLSGGGDIDPELFGEQPHVNIKEFDAQRDHYELCLIERAMALDLPILGICHGMQMLNIAAGGNIYQDIITGLPDTLQHSQQCVRWQPFHHIALAEGSKLAAICGADRIRVNSCHHQAVRQVACNYAVCAVSDDGVIEAIENNKYRFVIGVQWHPEWLYQHDLYNRRLWEAFIAACK